LTWVSVPMGFRVWFQLFWATVGCKFEFMPYIWACLMKLVNNAIACRCDIIV
jgi:hypothetical protein